MEKIKPLLGILLLLLISVQVNASIITWQITGSVFDVNPELTSVFSVSDTLNASLTFDTTTPDVEPGVPDRGKYNSAATMSVNIGGYTGTSDQMYITVIDNFTSDGSDRFLTSSVFESNTTGDDIGDFSFNYLNMFYRDDGGTMFS